MCVCAQVITKDEIMNVLTRPAGDARTFNTRYYHDFVLLFDFNKVDQDQSGAIDIDEFVQALLPHEVKSVFFEYDHGMKSQLRAVSVFFEGFRAQIIAR